MKKKWINKGDNILVIAGNDKGKVGKVLETRRRSYSNPRCKY